MVSHLLHFVWIVFPCITYIMSYSSLQYTTAKDGSVMGVTVTNHGMVTHCRTLTQACSYTEGKCCDHNSHFIFISC